MNSKNCSKCNKVKPITEFWKDKSKKSGHNSRCKQCRKKEERKYRQTKAYKDRQQEYKESGRAKEMSLKSYYKRMADPQKRRDRRDYDLRRRYGVSIDEHDQAYFNQNGCCAICHTPINIYKAHTDHNHLTGKFRGLLCHCCNVAIGFLFVDERGFKVIDNVKDYLRQAT